MNSYTVYKYTSPSGKSYIGITSKPLIKRANYNGTGYTACPHFCKAIKNTAGRICGARYFIQA